jgi:hypothetical protein
VDIEVLKYVEMLGKAIFTTLESRGAMKVPIAMAKRIILRCLLLKGGSADSECGGFGFVCV